MLLILCQSTISKNGVFSPDHRHQAHRPHRPLRPRDAGLSRAGGGGQPGRFRQAGEGRREGGRLRWRGSSSPPAPAHTDHRLLQPRQDGQHRGERLQQAGDGGGGAIHPRCSVRHPLPGQETVGGLRGNAGTSGKGAPAGALQPEGESALTAHPSFSPCWLGSTRTHTLAHTQNNEQTSALSQLSFSLV